MRKRRTRYQWLLPLGTVGPGADTQDDYNGLAFNLATNLNGTTSIQIEPLVFDHPSDESVAGNLPNIVQTMGNDYFIKRIVGKLFAGLTQSNTTGAPAGVLLGVGFFIARANDADIATPVPIGTATGNDTGAVDNYSPLRAENGTEPWIWRRTWVLGNVLAANPPTGFAPFPQTTGNYGSIQDGPHIDAKTARRVKDGERLWVALATKPLPLNDTFDVSATVNVILDYRVLGQLRKSRNRSAF